MQTNIYVFVCVNECNLSRYMYTGCEHLYNWTNTQGPTSFEIPQVDTPDG